MPKMKHSRKPNGIPSSNAGTRFGFPRRSAVSKVVPFLVIVAIAAMVSCGQSRNDEVTLPTTTSQSQVTLPTITSRSQATLPTITSRSERTLPTITSRSQGTIPTITSRSEPTRPTTTSRSEPTPRIEPTPTEDNRPRTVEDYARRCTGYEGNPFAEFDTVYEMVDELREGVGRMRQVIPPAEVRDYHEAIITAAEEFIEVSRFLRGSDKPSEWLYATLSQPRQARLIRANEEFNAALSDLDPDVRKTLQRYRCID